MPSLGVTTKTDTSYKPNAEELAASGPQDLWLPPSPIGKEFPDVPAVIGEAADEAYRCLSVKSERGAIILARAVLEATCKDKGAEGRDLRRRVDDLHAKNFVGNLVREEAHEIRHMGNDMAHGDFETEVTEDDATDVLALMDQVLAEVYQRPAAVERRRTQRGARGE